MMRCKDNAQGTQKEGRNFRKVRYARQVEEEREDERRRWQRRRRRRGAEVVVVSLALLQQGPECRSWRV